MASKYNRVKGSIFETDVMKWLRKAGVLAERLTKAGRAIPNMKIG